MKKVIGHNQAKNKLMSNLSVQSWLICGKKGIGKATLAKFFSDWLLTKDSGSAALDLHVIEGDTIGIEKVREMKNFLHLSPIQSEYKIAVIDSLEAMTNNAKNAILKILEEPPRNSKIFIISHKPHDIQTTIKCRCFQLNLLPLTYDEAKEVVSSQCKLDDQTFDKIVTLFPGLPGMIINAMNNNTYELYQHFCTLFHNLNNPDIINKAINSDIELELASHIIQTFILKSIRENTDKIRLLSKFASERQVLEAHGAENRSVLDIHENLSTGVTTQLSVEVEFRKKSIEILLSQWKKVDELFVAAKQFHLDKKHVLANAVNIITIG